MPVIPLVPSDSSTLISSLLRLSAHHLALEASALQPLKSGTLSLHLSIPVPVLIPSVVTSRTTTASRPSSSLNPSPLAPQIRLLLTIVRLYKLYLLTYLRRCLCLCRASDVTQRWQVTSCLLVPRVWLRPLDIPLTTETSVCGTLCFHSDDLLYKVWSVQPLPHNFVDILIPFPSRRRPMLALGRSAPLIRFLISALYI